MDHQARLVLSYQGSAPDDELLAWIVAGQVAGVVLFADNFVSATQLTEAVSQLKEKCPFTLRVMIDEEGGPVRRLPDSISPMPAIAQYGKRGDAAGAAADYAAICRTLAAMGIDTLLAPVLDLRSSSNDWLADRTFSSNPKEVADFAQQAVTAIQSTGISACAKHFPGLGGAARDLHDQQFIINDQAATIAERDLMPFRAAVAAGVEMIMVSHAVYENVDKGRPAVFSPAVVKEMLKEQLGFRGLVLTDCLTMGAIMKSTSIEKAIELSLKAGCDRILVCNNRSLQRQAIRFAAR